jgi:hypothetical protein
VKDVRGGIPNQKKAGCNRPLNEADYEKGWKPRDTQHAGRWKGSTHWTKLVAENTLEFFERVKKDVEPLFMKPAFNAPHDQQEKNDLIDNPLYASVVKRLKREVVELQKELGDDLDLEAPPAPTRRIPQKMAKSASSRQPLCTRRWATRETELRTSPSRMSVTPPNFAVWLPRGNGIGKPTDKVEAAAV